MTEENKEETTEDQDQGGPFSPKERKMMREMLNNYERSQWLFIFTVKIAKWFAAIVAGLVAYKQLPGLLGWK